MGCEVYTSQKCLRVMLVTSCEKTSIMMQVSYSAKYTPRICRGGDWYECPVHSVVMTQQGCGRAACRLMLKASPRSASSHCLTGFRV